MATECLGIARAEIPASQLRRGHGADRKGDHHQREEQNAQVLELLRISAGFGQNHARNLRSTYGWRKVKPRLAKRLAVARVRRLIYQ